MDNPQEIKREKVRVVPITNYAEMSRAETTYLQGLYIY